MPVPPSTARIKATRNLIIVAPSLHLDVGSLDDRPPGGDVGLLLRDQSFWRLLLARRNFHAEAGQPAAHLGIGERVLYRGLKSLHDRRRRAARRPEAIPQRHMQPGRAGF